MLYYYLLIILIIFFSIITTDKNKKITISIVVILFSLLSGLRHYSIGNDTYNYIRHFWGITQQGLFYIKNSRFEIGYSYLVYFLTHLSENYTVFLLIVSFFINIMIGKFIYNYSKSPAFSLLLFILLRFFFGEMNIMRQFIALCIFINSIKYIENRNFIKFTIVAIIASTIHSSALFAFFIYFLYNLKLSLNKKVICVIVATIVFFLLYKVLIYLTGFLGIYSSYVTEYFGSNKLASIISFIISLLVYVFCNIIQKKYNKSIKNDDPLEYKRLNFYNNIAFVMIIINFLAIRISILDRVTDYYEIFYILLIPNTINMIKERKKRSAWYIAVFVCFFAYFLAVTFLRPNWNFVNPYRFFWQ